MSLLLEAKSITKAFAGMQALDRVSFDLIEGEVHALVGENGAGKSTLIKIMTGAVKADSGTLFVSGRPVPNNDPGIARSLGIAAIYQQPALFPHLTVAENIAVALETGSLWRQVNWKTRYRRATELLDAVFPKREVPKGAVVLELCNAGNRARDLHDISLSVRSGEILGLAGLVGAGRTELAETIFGLTPADSGEVRLRGAAVKVSSPS